MTKLPKSRKFGKGSLGLLAAVALAAGGATSELHAQWDAGKYTGGGFIQSSAGTPRKATFGFNLQAVDGDGDGWIDRAQIIQGGFLTWWEVGQGQFQYADHAAGVKFHLDHDASYELNPDGSIPDRVDVRIAVLFNPFRFVALGFDWIGTYHCKEGTGKVKITVNSEEDAFGSLVDTISVRVQSGPYGPGGQFLFGYRNSGVLQGGNIEWHPVH